MVKIGVLSDTHQPSADSTTYVGPQDAITTALDQMGSTFGVDDIILLGDKVHPDDDETSKVPHVRPAAFDEFWSYANASDHSDKIRASMPSHHSVPIQQALRADGRETVGPLEIDYGGVRLYLVSTVATGTITGSVGATGSDNVGVAYGRVPEYQLRWLDDRLQVAEDNGDAQLVLSHRVLNMSETQGAGQFHPYQDFGQGQGESGALNYWVVMNERRVHNILKQYSKVVCYNGHKYNPSGGAGALQNWTRDGVESAYDRHWYNVGTDSVDGDYSIIDINASSATITSVHENTTTDTRTLLNVTF